MNIELSEDWINPADVLGDNRVDLVGVDSNAGAIMHFVNRALKDSGNSSEVQNAYRKEAMSGNYDNLLVASMTYLGAI